MPKDDLRKSSKAHTQYKTDDGEKVPSVTTILGVLNKPYLVVWANRLGLDGIDSTKYTDAAAKIGTLAHYLIECYLAKRRPLFDKNSKFEIDKAMACFNMYKSWEKGHRIKPVASEMKLISEKYGYGGTIDFLCYLDGVLTLVDFKTSKAIYDEMLLQLCAYVKLLQENGYDIKQAKILRIGRDESEGFEERTITKFTHRFKIFRHCLRIYQLKAQL